MEQDRGERFGIVKGWLIAKEAPQEVHQAMEGLRDSAAQEVTVGPSRPLVSQEELECLFSRRPGEAPPDATGGGNADQETQPDALPRKRRGKEPRIPDDQVEVVREMMKTMNDVQIGQHYGYGSQTAADFRRRHGLKRPKGNPNWHKGNTPLGEPLASSTS